MSNDSCLRGVAIGISSQVQPFEVKVEECLLTSEAEAHTGPHGSCWVYALTKICEAEESVFSVKLDFIRPVTPSPLPPGTHSFYWTSSVLLLALTRLDMSFVLVSMILVPGTKTDISS